MVCLMNEDADQMSANLLSLSILCLMLALAPASGLQSHAAKMNSFAFSSLKEFPDSPVTVKDENLDSLLKLYPYFVVDLLEDRMRVLRGFQPDL